MKGARPVAKAADGDDQLVGHRADDGALARRPYVTPELIEYGTVAKLTQTGGQTVSDFFAFRRMMTCL
jgi:hypothetical protein